MYDRCKGAGNYSALVRFWHLIETEPRELIGLRHVSLEIRCLDECENDQRVNVHKSVLDNIKKWSDIENVSFITDVLSISNSVGKEVIPQFLEALKDKDENVRRGAAKALGNVGVGHGDIVIPALINALKDDNKYVRSRASQVLGKVGVGHGEIVIPALINALKDEDVRSRAAKALGKVGVGYADVVVPALINAL
ncbi:HEAT repeat domain-containing protein, partial [Candidatus Jidaibacter acanthamoebae]|uniref:HEAT repeat domain-containing protein n=1 Tax=Candidatus Jidaibacter acanthamoebae TaxID=86105 RepID=UPI0013791EBB